MDNRDISSMRKRQALLPRKPGLLQRRSGEPIPARLHPITPATIESGNVSPGQGGPPEDPVPMPQFVAEKRIPRRHPAVGRHPLPLAAVDGSPHLLQANRSSSGGDYSEGVSTSSSAAGDTIMAEKVGGFHPNECWAEFNVLPTGRSDDVLGNLSPSRTEDEIIMDNSCCVGGGGRVDDMECSHVLRGGTLTTELLRDWLGCSNLKKVTAAEMRLDTESLIGVDQLRSILPSLVSLRLSGSRIPSVRQLGLRYPNLNVLWLNSCRLGDLRGIGSLGPSIRELYVAFNNIKDLTPLLDISMTLEVLDVEGNQLADVASLRFVLLSLTRVHTITLQGNPIEENTAMSHLLQQEMRDSEPSASVEGGDKEREPSQWSAADAELDDVFGGENQLLLFRRWVQLLMPRLQFLDDIPLLTESCSRVQSESPGRPPLSATDSPVQAKPSVVHEENKKTFRQPSFSFDQVDTALREELRFVQECIRESGFDTLQQTLEKQRVGISSRASSSSVCGSSHSFLDVKTPTDCSNLTRGGVLAGSAIASLRRRLHPQEPVGVRRDKGHGSDDSMVGVRDNGNEDDVKGIKLTTNVCGSSSNKLVPDDLLGWDDADEDEGAYERFKADLLRSKISALTEQKANPPQYRQRYEELKKKGMLLQGSSNNRGAPLKCSSSLSSKREDAEDEAEDQTFDSFLKHEVIRTRAQIAREGEALDDLDFVSDLHSFEVIDVGLNN